MAKRLKINICRVKTDRFYDMGLKQLQNTLWRLRRDDSRARFFHQLRDSSPRGLVTLFVKAVDNVRHREAEIRLGLHGRVGDPIRQKADEHVAMLRAEADRLEQKIWDRQAKHGCAISPDEAVARDAARQGNVDQETIDRLRGKRRARIR